MGKEVWQALSGREHKRIDAYPEPYLIGLHGPDILFYYHALSNNPVNAIGYGLHVKPGKTFFEQVRMTAQHSPEQDAALSYAYGLLNHFALDVSCHAYVDEKIAASGVTHTEIEVEFDRSLMLKDRLNPVTHILTDHIQPSSGNAKVIAPFYPGTTQKQIQKALVCIVGYIAVCLYALTLRTLLHFAILAFGVGCFQGSIQSLSRSYYARIIPAENSGEYFGIYDIFSKGASFLGSAVLAAVKLAGGSINVAVACLTVFFVLGFVFLKLANRQPSVR